METGIQLVLHPGHVHESMGGSIEAPQPILDEYDAAIHLGQLLVLRMQNLQNFAEEEALNGVPKLDGSSAYLEVHYSTSGLTIMTARGGTSVRLSPFFSQIAKCAVTAPVEFPPGGGSIIGVIACGCPPSGLPDHLETRQRSPANLQQEGLTGQFAVWLFLVISNDVAALASHDASHGASPLLCRAADELASIGMIRNDLHEAFQLEDILGSGAFASVHQVARREPSRRRGNSELIAAKVINSSASMLQVAAEASYLVACQSHPNVVKFLGLYCLGEGSWTILMERCNGEDFKQYIEANGPQEELNALELVAKGLLSALGHIHAHKVIHKDVKPENLLIDYQTNTRRLVLVDFGISCHFSEEAKLRHRCGSPGSIAPEVLMKSRWTPKADVFSAGVAFFYSLCAKMPFEGEDLMMTLRINARARVNLDQESFSHISFHTKEFLASMLQQKSHSRPTATQASERLVMLLEVVNARAPNISAPSEESTSATASQSPASIPTETQIPYSDEWAADLSRQAQRIGSVKCIDRNGKELALHIQENGYIQIDTSKHDVPMPEQFPLMLKESVCAVHEPSGMEPPAIAETARQPVTPTEPRPQSKNPRHGSLSRHSELPMQERMPVPPQGGPPSTRPRQMHMHHAADIVPCMANTQEEPFERDTKIERISSDAKTSVGSMLSSGSSWFEPDSEVPSSSLNGRCMPTRSNSFEKIENAQANEVGGKKIRQHCATGQQGSDHLPLTVLVPASTATKSGRIM
jgi:serine/threonine protein kinase